MLPRFDIYHTVIERTYVQSDICAGSRPIRRSKKEQLDDVQRRYSMDISIYKAAQDREQCPTIVTAAYASIRLDPISFRAHWLHHNGQPPSNLAKMKNLEM